MELPEPTAIVAPNPRRPSNDDHSLCMEPPYRPQFSNAVLKPSFDGRLPRPDGPVANDCNDCDEPLEY